MAKTTKQISTEEDKELKQTPIIKTDNLTQLDIKDLMAYHDATLLLSQRFTNMAMSSRSLTEEFQKQDYEFYTKKASMCNNILSEIFNEIEKRVFNL